MAIFKGAELTASNNKTYRWLGAQWAEVTKSGKTGRMATRAIAQELDRKAAEEYLSDQPSVFDNLLLKGIRSGMIPARTQEAKDWFRDKAKGTDINQRDLLAERTRLTNTVAPGKMYFFQYYPKHEKTLPYYDMFPLIFPIEKYDNGFLGINMHYLPYNLRAKLMDALYSISSNTRFDETTKLKASYDVLKSASKYKYFIPTVKRYLTKQVRSRFIEVYASEWDIALFLPVSQFKKASERKVWAESRKKLK